MKKILSYFICIVLLISMLTVPVFAASDTLNTADALYKLGLFLGYGRTYGLKDPLSRDQGIVLLIRMLGKEKEVLSKEYDIPFVDVEEYAASYVGYAYQNGLTKGYNDTHFGGTDALTDQQFYTFVLRALGYSDSGEKQDFSYEQAIDKAYEIGIATSNQSLKRFTRGDVVTIFWKALNTKMNGARITLAKNLEKQGVFTAAQFKAASAIQEFGRSETDETGQIEPETPVEPEQPTEPETPQKPEEQVEPETPKEPEKPAEQETPKEPEKPAEQETPKEPEKPSEETKTVSYEDYQKMTPEEQDAFSDTFPSIKAFKEWLKAALDKYNEEHPTKELNPGDVIDLSK